MIRTVLIGNNHLNELGGSEIFTFTLIKAIKELGYDVYFTTFITGLVSKKCEEYATYIPPQNIANYQFDRAILSHNSIVNLPIKARSIIQVCHGILPKLEKPSPLANYHISISQKIVGHLHNHGFKSDVINNPVDLSKFRPISKIHSKPQTILSLCQGEEANKNIKDVCKRMGIEFLSFSKTRTATWDLHKVVNKADIVISIGRGVYEAMACGRNVIIYDSRGYASNKGDGYLSKDNFFLSHASNCVGDDAEIDFDVDLLEKEILKYSTLDSDWNYKTAHHLFDSQEIAKKLLSINKPSPFYFYPYKYFYRLAIKLKKKFKL